jgi:cytochrome c553
MKNRIAAGSAIALVIALGGLRVRAADFPAWAYGATTPVEVRLSTMAEAPPVAIPPAPELDNTTKLSLARSKSQFTAAQIFDRYSPADWFPEDHGAMPEIVAKGRTSDTRPIWACAYCHLPNGRGSPANADLTGLTFEYLMQQLYDFKNGRRESADHRKIETQLMIAFAKAMTSEDIEVAARYYSSLNPTPWIKVVESNTVPKTMMRDGVFVPIVGEGAGAEPLGSRIVEVPSNIDDFTKHSPRASFTAYVPKGSVERGESLVRTGAGVIVPCVECHGDNLRGGGAFPSIAGRAPSYLMRQMFDMVQRKREGLLSIQMAPLLYTINEEDMMAASAYLATLAP